MPILESTAPQVEDQPVPTFPQERQSPETHVPGTAFTRALIEETTTGRLVGNVEGAFAPQPPAAQQPGYDPVQDIPAPFLKDYGHEYLHLDNPAQVAAKNEEIRARVANQSIIARTGKWGVAATMAAGAVDPVNLASMALIPEAAPTRAGNAIRWALANAGVSGTQELLEGAMGYPETPGEGALNIGASAVLGGILGPLAPRVPKAKLQSMENALNTELRAPASDAYLPEPSKVLGPLQRSVIEDAEGEVHPEVEAGYTGGIEPEVPGVERRPLTYIPPKPEGPTTPRPGVTPEIEPQRMSLGEAIAVSKGAEAKSHGLSYMEGLAQGLDPADMDAARFGNRRLFTKGGTSFDDMANMLSQHGYPVVDEEGHYSPNALLEALDAELRGRKQYSPHAEDYLAGLEEHAKASEAADRGVEAPTPREKEMEREAAGVEERNKELEAMRAEAHALPGEPLFEPEEIEPAHVSPEEESTAGAKAVGGRTKADLDIARGGQLYSRTIGVTAPGARLMASPSTKVRQLTMELGNLYGTTEGNYRDIANARPVERDLWQDVEAAKAAGIAKTSELYRKYRDRVTEEGGTPISRAEFAEEAGKAGRRGDRSSIPEAAERARWSRSEVKEPWHQRAVDAGMMKEEHPLFAESYQTRLFNMPKIRANNSEWLEFLRRQFIKKGVDPAEAMGIAYDTDRNVGASERGQLDTHAFDGLVPKSGRTKARTLAIHDLDLEPWLIHDIDHLDGAYLQTLVPEVHMVERFGDRDLAERFQAIGDEYAHLSEQARAQGDNERMGYLKKSMATDLRTLKAVRDQLYGNYGVPKDPGSFMVRAGRFMRAFNIPRMLGGATFKHFPDLANTIQQFGATNTFATMAKLATSLDATRLGFREAKRIGVAIDMTMNTAAAALWDAGAHSQFPEQRFMRRMNRMFTIATGETPLITATQTLAAIMGHDEILRTAGRLAGGQVVNKNLLAKLAAGGLDTGMLERIAQAADRHGREINGIRFGMSEQWADKDAARAFESAVARQAHGVTMRPGILDKPLFMSKEWGKFIFQFKSFEFAASRVVGLQMLQGLAHGDVRAMSGLLAQFAMATAGYVAYQKATGQKVELNPKKLAVELIDRTNLLGWTNSVIFPALYHAGFKDMTRWYDKDPISAMGPSVELGKDLLERQLPGRIEQAVMGRQGSQRPLPFRRSDLHFMRRMLPANQIWYARKTLDNLEDAFGDNFDLPGKSLAERKEEIERGDRTQ